ncbi:hypothetical protein [Gabonibacter chumensis]|uniref:hypothetical protein n=1 Tax=Gabonibacter chumensis TaxID=2972474 RepID=UPI0025737D6D|nr:hypothetical protein [Gabonibacter chumensis]MCR9011696.1 hypothetical protein [Gabonibacter chumensis]
MKKVFFVFSISLILLLVMNSCYRAESSLETDNLNEKKDSNVQYLEDFFAIEQDTYKALIKDPLFEELCQKYEHVRSELSRNTTNDISKKILHLNDIFPDIDSLVNKYECYNLFSYILFHTSNTPQAKISHDWGACYYNMDIYGSWVCDTRQMWRDAWYICSENECAANQYLDSRLDLREYREALSYYLSHANPRFNYARIYCLFKGETTFAGDYSYAIDADLRIVVSDIRSLGYGGNICQCIGELKESFIDFYCSRAWTKCTTDYLVPPTYNVETAGGISNAPKIDVENLKDNDYIDCIYAKVNSKSLVFKRLVEDFMKENSIAHLKWELADLSQNVNGELISKMNNYWFTIQLNESNLMYKPPLIVAKTIIHEAIHAKIYAQLLTLRSHHPSTLVDNDFQTLSEALDDQSFPTLFYFYKKYCYNAPAHHQYMSEYYVYIIARALQEIEPGTEIFTCIAIAWEGLKYVDELKDNKWIRVESEGWKKNSQGQRDSLNTLYLNYLRNTEIICTP